jgi:hypothetical protein
MNTRPFAGALAPLAVAALLLLIPSAGHAQINRSQCFQYGGASVCYMPVIGRWKYAICEEGPPPGMARSRSMGSDSIDRFKINGVPRSMGSDSIDRG